MNELPDSDAIKMFVGQIPKQWMENDVRIHFAEFGRIYMVNVLRDKVTKQSRGCCFITFYTRKSALEAQNACHNIRVLTGMSHPIQMKPADNENRHERKIFVGMLQKSLTESDLRILFLRFGLIEEISILRDSNGNSRGCGFVTFASKVATINAIKTMHQSTIMDGCSSPLVVKIADAQRDKNNSKKISQSQCQGQDEILTFPTSPIQCQFLSQDAQQYYIRLLQLLQQQSTTSNFSNPMQIYTNSSILNDFPTINLQSNCFGSNITNPTSTTSLQNFYTTENPTTTIRNLISNNITLENNNLGGTLSLPEFLNNTVIQLSEKFQNTQTEGPEGSNLFIYHLPQDFSERDLIQSFLPYGSILSAKIFIDKNTNLSKCFGFVSYDNRISAQLAIIGLNGVQIGSKRLKVQLKRPKNKQLN